jgi:hypothetical protein
MEVSVGCSKNVQKQQFTLFHKTFNNFISIFYVLYWKQVSNNGQIMRPVLGDAGGGRETKV